MAASAAGGSAVYNWEAADQPSQTNLDELYGITRQSDGFLKPGYYMFRQVFPHIPLNADRLKSYVLAANVSIGVFKSRPEGVMTVVIVNAGDAQQTVNISIFNILVRAAKIFTWSSSNQEQLMENSFNYTNVVYDTVDNVDVRRYLSISILMFVDSVATLVFSV
jgi:hypothetical protein